MRRAVSAVAAAGLAACSFALDAPAPFVVEGERDARAPADARPDAERVRDAYVAPDAFVVRDAGPDASPRPDAVVDAAPVADAFNAPDAAPTDAGCMPSPEVCNGVNDDCDDATDESFAEECQPCGLPGRLGICARGATVCVQGAVQCVPWLPPAGEGEPCNTLDDDCDGRVDEAGDVAPLANPVEATLAAVCGGRPDLRPEDGRCLNGQVGCAASHECVAPGCRTNCHDNRAVSVAACGRCAEGNTPVEACYDDCVAVVEQVFRGCLSACSAIDQGGASRWVCEGGPSGPVCRALDCPEGTRADGQACVPDTEVCNNGLDDDGDGLVDGALSGADPCAAPVDARGQTVRIGTCSRGAADPSCDDTATIATPANPSDSSEWADELGTFNRQVTLDYAYAMDREEVSIRAYRECVQSGCCLEPIGPIWRKAVVAMDAGLSPTRPAAPPTDVATVDVNDPDQAALLPDLPVTGLSWCMARDYCSWVGKRLPTEVEWEWAASRPQGDLNTRRTFPWGNASAAECPSTQCCRAADFVGPMPGPCVDPGRGINALADLPVCVGDTPEAGWRFAHVATYNDAGEQCGRGNVLGSGPVFANQDGQTPDGLLNMSGNVNEWVFDWASRQYGGLNDRAPVGPICDSTDFPRKRMVRGGDYTTGPLNLRNQNRFALWESTRAPILGFRCARTLQEDGALCDPGVPEVDPRCRPQAPAGAPLAPCAAPNFAGSDPRDQSECVSPERVNGRYCDEGLSAFCSSDDAAGVGCNAYIISRLELPVGLIGADTDIALMNTVLNNSLAPRGGSTILALAPNNVFRLGGNYRFEIGTAEVNADGELAWVGLDRGGGVCQRTQVGSYEQRTVQQRRDLTPSCSNITDFEFWLRESPVSLPFSAVSVEAQYEPIDETLTGTLQLVMTLGDVAQAQFGVLPPGESGEALSLVLDRIGAQALSLCGLPLGASCFGTPLYMPGCSGLFQCDEPSTCRGWPLPFRFEAVRADRAGLQNLVCPGP